MVEVPLCQIVRVRLDYGLQGVVDGVLAAHQLVPTNSHYGADIELELAVPVDDLEAVVVDLRERSGGRANIEFIDDRDA